MEDITIRFLSAGLNKNEKCICLLNPNRPKSVHRFVENNLASPNIKPDQLVFIDVMDAYLNGTRLDPMQMMGFLTRQLLDVSREGYESTRFVLDMGWAGHDDWALLDCENLLNKHIVPYFNCTIMCGYNPEKMNPQLFREIAISHPRLMCGHQVINNQAYDPPKPFWLMPKEDVL